MEVSEEPIAGRVLGVEDRARRTGARREGLDLGRGRPRKKVGALARWDAVGESGGNDEDSLADVAALPQTSARHDVRERRDLRPIANTRRLDQRQLVFDVVHRENSRTASITWS